MNVIRWSPSRLICNLAHTTIAAIMFHFLIRKSEMDSGGTKFFNLNEKARSNELAYLYRRLDKRSAIQQFIKRIKMLEGAYDFSNLQNTNFRQKKAWTSVQAFLLNRCLTIDDYSQFSVDNEKSP